MRIIIMGVSGTGKSTVGRILAEKLRCSFFDGDNFHCPANIAKMSAGIPLEDSDRQPWLRQMNAVLRQHELDGKSMVLACSALKQSYRELLSEGLKAEIVWVHLTADAQVIADRLQSRADHFFKAYMLASQIATLQPPNGALEFVIDNTPSSSQRISNEIFFKLKAVVSI